MLDFIFDAGFDGLIPGRAGERSRARRAAKTLDEFGCTGTVTFPAAIRTTGALRNGYLTLRAESIIFSQVAGSEITHTDVDLTELQTFWPTTNAMKSEYGVNKWWTLVRLAYATDVTVLACAPNGSTTLIKLLADCRVPQLEP